MMIIVKDYDDAIVLHPDARFELIEDSPARTNDGRTKRWVVVRLLRAEKGILLAAVYGWNTRSPRIG